MSATTKHIPVGPWKDRTRQVLTPKPPKRRRRYGRPLSPMTCGALNGTACTAVVGAIAGEPVPHRGKHRTRILDGITIRWDD